jgi:hypothetical protein
MIECKGGFGRLLFFGAKPTAVLCPFSPWEKVARSAERGCDLGYMFVEAPVELPSSALPTH